MSRGRSHRPERLAALIKEVMGEAFMGQLKDPRVGFVTIMGVTVSADGGHARVRVSVLGSDDEKAEAMVGLESARGYLRSHLAKTLPLRIVPELHFELDRGLEHAQRIDQILNDLSETAES